MAILFGRPFGAASREVIDDFDDEVRAVQDLDVEAHVIDLELVAEDAAELACEELPERRTWLYRGWILREDEYEALYDAVSATRGRLVVDPRAYARALYLPEWYPEMADVTPRSRWIEGTDLDEAWSAACELGAPPWIVKDHVKSAKEKWLTACYVPAGADRGDFERVCQALVDEQGDRFERGIVIREAVPLRELGYRMLERAVPDEHRVFVYEGEIIAHAPYHDAPAEPLTERELRPLRLERRIDSPFYTVDVARRPSGELVVIEVNDGGISALPAELDPRELVGAILERS